MKGRSIAIVSANFAKVSDCGPSESAFSGVGWTSIISPSAPAATAAHDMGGTRRATPVAWDGSTMTGRWVRSLRTGIAERSRVFRVASSKVRIPRSHRITWRLPSDRQYSALIRYSVIVVIIPRLRRMGRFDLPIRLRREKFWTLRAPTWRMSEYSAISSTSAGFITSVTIGIPARSPALRRILRPFSSSPWKAYGEVRGFHAPPRSTWAPAFFTASAVSIICASLSTEQGPAMTRSCRSPTVTPGAIRMTVRSGFTSRLASLYGLRIGTTRSTPGSDSRPWRTILPRSSPIAPMTVRSFP